MQGRSARALIAVLAAMLWLALAGSALAAERVCSLTIEYKNADGLPIEGAVFRLYRVAEAAEGGGFAAVPAFEPYVNLVDGGLNGGDWRALAELLPGYATVDDGIQVYTTPDGARCEGAVDKDGLLVLGGLEPGLYLAVGDAAAIRGQDGSEVRYAVKASLAALPGLDGDGVQRDDLTILPKEEPLDAEPVDLTVQKRWKGDAEADRPAEIRVQLLRDGAPADEAVLSRSNGWQYQWEKLEGGARWTVVENPVPAGYLPAYAAEGSLTVITNVKANPVSGGGKLPQTGLLRWPAPVLALAGIVLLLAGWMRSRKHEK